MKQHLPKLLVIYNPACGDGKAQKHFEEIVLPMLRDAGRTPDKIVATTHGGHAGEVVVEFLQQTEGPVAVVLGSGDGTLHEILCAVYDAAQPGTGRSLTFALVPCGTANALYASIFPPSPSAGAELNDSKTRSLSSLLAPGPGHARQIRVAKTTLSPSAAEDTSRVTRASIAAVVASTAFHAAILHDSENLRATNPGLDRFKIAAQRNLSKWYYARARLSVVEPAVAGATLVPAVEIYDPAQGHFFPYQGEGRSEDGKVVELDGPFAYFVSMVNADRLEPTFVIAPSQKNFPPPPLSSPATMDIVVVRPLRSPKVRTDSDDSRESFSHTLMSVMGGAYRNGAHVRMRYAADGGVVEDQQEGETVVEYFRCNRWEWIPYEHDEAAHLVCVDGEILQIEPNGKASCEAVHSVNGYPIAVYA